MRKYSFLFHWDRVFLVHCITKIWSQWNKLKMYQKDPVPMEQGGKDEHKTRLSTTTKQKHSIPR